MNNKVKLDVLGFSFNQSQSGTYGLVMSEDLGRRRLMIVVGAPEAQSIAFRLQNISPPRPLAHDLIKNILDAFGILMVEILIDKYEDGIFFSKLILKQGEQLLEIDSRTSDAVAIALRMEAPIYTTENIMKNMAVVIDNESFKEDGSEHDEEQLQNGMKKFDLSLLNTVELQEMLKTAIEDEDYEFASLLRDELVKKKKSE